MSFGGIGTGSGEIICNDCGYTELITLFTHGFGDDVQCTYGYQCLKCGRFQTVKTKQSDKQKPTLICSCGGELSNKHEVFCPECRGKNMVYEMGIMT